MKKHYCYCKHCDKPLAILNLYERAEPTSEFDDATYLFLYCKRCNQSTYFSYE